MKVIVVGANHAGTTAVRTLKRLNPDVEVVAYDRNDNISFLGCGIALWVKGEFNDPNGLFYASPELLTKEGITVKMRHLVKHIDPSAKKITVQNLETNEEFEDSYDKLILAIGSWPIIPPFKGLAMDENRNITLDNVRIVKWYQHGELIKQANDNPNIKNVVICGAGYIGVELVDAFNAKGKTVTLVDLQDRIMPNYYDKPFTDKVEKAMTEAGVKLHCREKVVELKVGNNKVVEVITEQATPDNSPGQQYAHKADLLIICVGFRPSTEMLRDVVELDKNGAIIVDETMKTSNDSIYAVGDCIEVYDNAKKALSHIALATTAVRSGIIAAINVLNPNGLRSPGFQGSNAINVFDWCLSSTGMTEEVAKKLGVDYELITFEDNDRPEFMKHYEKVLIRIVWEKSSRRIIGAQIASKENHTEVMYMFSLAILKGVTIDELPLIDIFFLPHFNKPYNFITLAGLEVLGLNYFKGNH